MTVNVTVRVLVENSVSGSRLRAEHGLAFWVEAGDRRVLFDAGQSGLLMENAAKLDLDVSAIDTIVLSHGHYDHTGGLAHVMGQGSRERCVYAHPDALLPKYDCKGGGEREIGMPSGAREALTLPRCRLITTRTPVEIAPGLWVTGEVPRHYVDEVAPDGFFKDPAGREADPLLDDQALFIETGKGTVVLLGCAHAGLINTLDHIQRLTNGRTIRAVVGGLHLGSASDSRLAWTISALRKFGIGLFGPMHCTGQKAVAAFWTAFPSACQECGVGTLFKF